MSDQAFEIAYARVRGSHDDQAWLVLSPREIADSIYREIRAIDHERMSGSEAERDRAPVAREDNEKPAPARPKRPAASRHAPVRPGYPFEHGAPRGGPDKPWGGRSMHRKGWPAATKR